MKKKTLAEAGARSAPAPLDAFFSSGARSAPELRPASGSQGLDSEPDQIRKCQTLSLSPGYLRKCLQTLTGCGNVLIRNQECMLGWSAILIWKLCGVDGIKLCPIHWQ